MPGYGGVRDAMAKEGLDEVRFKFDFERVDGSRSGVAIAGVIRSADWYRIRERSADLPKALIPVLGKPSSNTSLNGCAAGCRSVVLSVAPWRDIAAVVGDGARFGLRSAYSDEGEKLRGTGGALRLAAVSTSWMKPFFCLRRFIPADRSAPVWRTSEEEESAR